MADIDLCMSACTNEKGRLLPLSRMNSRLNKIVDFRNGSEKKNVPEKGRMFHWEKKRTGSKEIHGKYMYVNKKWLESLLY